MHLKSVPWDFETVFNEIGVGEYTIGVPCIFIDIAAHDLGHLAHKDTDLILLMEVVEKDYG
ncbi:MULTISPECIES: hypothetical protein [unclassified Clostridium]|uniref:hypothetical protein n=1 Tax=unclassified Clostridium TaxID=2614128 RepID=UPI002079BA9F|nr:MULTISPECIES: hypothetical protein [unclassified Clostridium]